MRLATVSPQRLLNSKRVQAAIRAGAPKGTLNLVTDLTAELSEKVTIREDGRSRTITKQRALRRHREGERMEQYVTQQNLIRRRLFIGGSDARVIMGSDEAALLRLWREKRGRTCQATSSSSSVWQPRLSTGIGSSATLGKPSDACSIGSDIL